MTGSSTLPVLSWMTGNPRAPGGAGRIIIAPTRIQAEKRSTPSFMDFPRRRLFAMLPVLWTLLSAVGLDAADKKVLLIAGHPSHGPGFHEHNAGVLLLQKCLA